MNAERLEKLLIDADLRIQTDINRGEGVARAYSRAYWALHDEIRRIAYELEGDQS